MNKKETSLYRAQYKPKAARPIKKTHHFNPLEIRTDRKKKLAQTSGANGGGPKHRSLPQNKRKVVLTPNSNAFGARLATCHTHGKVKLSLTTKANASWSL